VAEQPPPQDPEDSEEDPPASFFAELLARTHGPYTLPTTVVGYRDRDGPWELSVTVALDPPDDAAVAALDDAGGALDELEILAGDQYDDLCDVLETLDRSPARAADDVLGHFHLTHPPSIGWYDLVERVNVYGRGLQYDLWERGHLLSDYFRGTHPDGWEHLLEVAARLPAGSHYRSAQLDDDDLARRVAEQYGPPSKRKKPGSNRPPLEGYTTEVSYLHRIENRLQFLGWAVFAAQAGKKRGTPPRPSKGPETADDRYEFLDFMAEHEDVVSQVLRSPDKTDQPPPLNTTDQPRVPPPEAVRGAVMLTPPGET